MDLNSHNNPNALGSESISGASGKKCSPDDTSILAYETLEAENPGSHTVPSHLTYRNCELTNMCYFNN